MSANNGLRSRVRTIGVAAEVTQRLKRRQSILDELRTETMHPWALAAEHYSQLIGENLKHDGSHPIQLFLKVASDMMALTESDQEIPRSLATLHSERRSAALPYVNGGAR